MQYIQLQPQLPNDVPSANTGTFNVFIDEDIIKYKDENGFVFPYQTLEMDLGWNKEFTRLTVSGETVHKLIVDVNTQDILDRGNETWLIIDRYRGQRRVKDEFDNPYQIKSGFKHEIYPPENNFDRPSEVLLTGTTNVVDFGQENYFKPVFSPEYRVKPKGSNNKLKKSANVYLRFRLKYGTSELGYKITEPLISLQLIYNMVYNTNEDTYYPTISYKLVY